MTTATAAQLSDSARVFVEAAPHKLLIGEEWLEAASGETFETIDPATGDVICEVAKAGPEDVDRAVKAAQAALEGPWSEMPASGREQLMHKLGLHHRTELVQYALRAGLLRPRTDDAAS